MKKVIADFSHFCVETGETIAAGTYCYFDELQKAYYSLRADAVRIFLTAPDTAAGELMANEEPVRL